MMALIKAHCLKVGAKVIEDSGNLYAVKGESDTYPCVIAHTDQVQDKPCRAYQAKDIMFGLSLDGRSFEGLGADDKNGIWIALKCLESVPVMKAAFFRSEEIGCLGSAKATIKFFDDCRFVIQCDRKGGHDFINEIGCTELCSDAFVKAAKLKDFGFKKQTGMMTDVQQLRKLGVKASCCNISCGYYEPHTSREYTILPELKNTLAFVKSIIRNCTEVYEFVPKVKTYGSSYGQGYNGYGSLYGGGWSNTGQWQTRSIYDRIDDVEGAVAIHEENIDTLMLQYKNLLKRVAGLEGQLLKGKGNTTAEADDLPADDTTNN